MNTLNLAIKTHQNNFTLQCKQQFEFNNILGIFGHSGSGKTTLLRIIAGLNNQANGQVTFNNQSFQNSNTHQFIPCEKRKISMVFQDARLFPHLNVEKNLLFARNRCKDAQLNLQEIIELTSISSLLTHEVGELSSGQQQRVALARAILSEPQLLLLDEPFSALDRISKKSLISLLKKIQHTLKLPMIYVSHSSEELQQTADKLLVLEQGNIINYGDVHTIFHQLNHTELIHQQTSFTATVIEVDKHHRLITISCDGDDLYFSDPLMHAINDVDNIIDKTIRCYILASDISIATKEPSDSSIVNVLPATITHIEQKQSQVLVSLMNKKQEYFANISSYSLEKLKLSINQNVYIQFKANAIKTLLD